MDDRHLSGAQFPTAPSSDAAHAQSAYGDGDPLFGSHPGGYGQGAYAAGGHLTDPYATAGYPTTGYDAAYGSTAYDPYPHAGYDAPGYATDAAAPYGTGYDTTSYGHADGGTAYGTGGYDGGGHPGGGFDGTVYGAGHYGSADARTDSYATAPYATDPYATGSYADSGYGTGAHGDAGYDYGSTAYDTASFAATATAVQEPVGYEATAVWSTADYADLDGRAHDPAPGIPAQARPPADDTVVWDQPLTAFAPEAEDGHDTDAADTAPDEPAIAEAMTQAMPVTAAPEAPAAGRRGPAADEAGRGGRSRRRQAKRSALLTVAVPSVAAMGVCAAAAASVGHFGGDAKEGATTQAAPDAGAAKRTTTAANKKLDNQLAGLSASAQDFRDRASRTQERLDLRERQAQERKRKQEEAARKEALRPKFVLPVAQHGLSATFGQAGVNWMSVHTGIDFPVDYGTSVMAATDGTIRTQWNSAYGNMAILTAPDGTETWYCHLTSTKIRAGSVKAGDTIAYSGSSGNSTGPHLHFEVRPGGGAAIDPLPWLRAHGLNPN
ncbi:peptidoglycan DD-metalloendopeptidase family protein [Streptomyces sp. NPDC093707]|uniref:M23 family metallopeptidase n=1 Tax=Streptomyces sp. NPDC093707 TaxID=3154984 RepID=UPI00344E0FCF